MKIKGWRPYDAAIMSHGLLLLSLATPLWRRAGPVRLCAPGGIFDTRILGADRSRELLTFERMMRVKPYCISTVSQR